MEHHLNEAEQEVRDLLIELKGGFSDTEMSEK